MKITPEFKTEIVNGDSLIYLSNIDSNSVQLIITSPPYNIGKEYEKTSPVDQYLNWINDYIKEFYRVLSNTGSVCFQVGNYVLKEKGEVYPLNCLLFNHFINAGFKPRNRIIWTFGHGLHCSKRFSGRHETIMWFTKSDDYTFNLDPVRVPSKYPNKKHFKGPNKGKLSGNPLGKNPSDVWDIPNVKHNHPEKTAHPCQFPELLSDRLVLSLSHEKDLVLDPFMGSGTVLASARKYNRFSIGIDQISEYIEIANNRIHGI